MLVNRHSTSIPQAANARTCFTTSWVGRFNTVTNYRDMLIKQTLRLWLACHYMGQWYWSNYASGYVCLRFQYLDRKYVTLPTAIRYNSRFCSIQSTSFIDYVTVLTFRIPEEWLDYSILRSYEHNEYACNVPGTITGLPNLFAPITTFNHHMTAIVLPTMHHLIHKP